MKVCLDVTTNKTMIAPKKNNLILFDGKKWYITTREDVFAEYEAKMDEKIEEINQKMSELEAFRAEIARQIATLSEMVRDILTTKGEKE